LKDLVDQNCLVSINDSIPGLNTANGKFPMPRERFDKPLQVNNCQALRKKPIYLHGLTLRSSAEFEKQFESFLRGVVKVENGDDEISNLNVMIRQRSIYVNVNNTWRNLNGNDTNERFSIMGEPGRDGICHG